MTVVNSLHCDGCLSAQVVHFASILNLRPVNLRKTVVVAVAVGPFLGLFERVNGSLRLVVVNW